MKIFILDDQPERHEGFRDILPAHQLTHVWTFDDAVEALSNTKFDMACLDHDLGDMTGWPSEQEMLPTGVTSSDNKVIIESLHFKLSFTPSRIPSMYGSDGGRFATGADLCWWLRNNPQHCPPHVHIHSWNSVGADNMQFHLKNIPGIRITRKEFNKNNPWR